MYLCRVHSYNAPFHVRVRSIDIDMYPPYSGLVIVLFALVCLSIAFVFLHFVDRLLLVQRTRRAFLGEFDSIAAADAPWIVNDVEYKNQDAGYVVTLRTVDYKRKLIMDPVSSSKKVVYGVSYPVNVRRTGQRNFARTVLPYRRKDVIYVPGHSDDTVECDDWSTKGSAKLLVRCNIADGLEGCFNCIESRRYVRQCVNIPRPFTVTLEGGRELVLPRNANANEGWCLPAAFKDVRVDKSGKLYPSFNEKRNCNPNTGDWILSRLFADEAVDSSYNWICRCRYPNLMTNIGDLTSDCVRPVGCRPNGELDERARAGLVDPYRDGTCICGSGYTPDTEPNVGPVCKPRNVTDYGLDNLYDKLLPSEPNWVPLPVSMVDRVFLDLFPVLPLSSIKLPNPCQFDAYDGKWLADDGCEARTVLVDGKERTMCFALNADHLAFVSETDYLLNNGGQYPNSCLRTGSTQNTVTSSENIERLTGQYVLSWWNGTSFPDVGQIVNVDQSESSIADKLTAIYEIVDKDEDYGKWYADSVTKYDDSGSLTKRLKLRFGVSAFFDQSLNRRMLLFYNANPLTDAVSFESAKESVAFFPQVFAPFGLTGSGLMDGEGIPLQNDQEVLLMNVNDRTMTHVRLFNVYSSSRDKYFRQTDEDYSRFPTLITNEFGGNCLGSGVLGGSTIYLTYEPIDAADKAKKRHGRQWFVRGPDDPYPAMPSTFSCNVTCPYSKAFDGSLDDAYAKEIPKMWPVVRVGKNRQLFPNADSPYFDATVQVITTKNFVVVSANGYSDNYLNYKSAGNVRRFFSTPPETIKDYVES